MKTNGINFIRFSNGAEITRAALFAKTIGKGTVFDDVINGSNGADTLQGGRGNDKLYGGLGADTYIFRRGDGSDLIDEGYQGTTLNRLVLPDHNPEDISLVQLNDNGDTLARLGNGDEILLVGQASYIGRIRVFEFGNGVIWNDARIAEAIAEDNGKFGYENLKGTTNVDVLQGTAADEIYDGVSGSDIFVYNRGGGRDVVTWRDNIGNDTLDIRGYNLADALIFNSPNGSNEIVIRFGNGDEVIVVGNDVKNFKFDDQTLNRTQIIDIITKRQTTSGHDYLIGQSNVTSYTPLQGDDFIDLHNATVTFRRGDGWDTFIDGTLYNTLVIEGYEPNEVTVNEIGFWHYLISFEGTDDQIDFHSSYISYYGLGFGVDEIQFASGAIWDLATIRAMASANVLNGNAFTAATEANQIISRPESELPPVIAEDAPTQVFNGGGGDDRIILYDNGPSEERSFSAADFGTTSVVHYARGDGQDTVDAGRVFDLLLSDLNPNEIEILYVAQDTASSESYFVRVIGTTDGVWIKNGVGNLNSIRFADETVWDQQAIDLAAELFIEAPVEPPVGGGVIYVGAADETIVSTGADEYYIQYSNDGVTGVTHYVYARGGGFDTIDETAATETSQAAPDTVLMSDINSTEIEVVAYTNSEDGVVDTWLDLIVSETDFLSIRGGYSSVGISVEAVSSISGVTFADGVTLTLAQLSALATTVTSGPDYQSGSFVFDRNTGTGDFYKSWYYEDTLSLVDVLPSEITIATDAEEGGWVLNVAGRVGDGSDDSRIHMAATQFPTVVLDNDVVVPVEFLEQILESGSALPSDIASRSLVGTAAFTSGVDIGFYVLSSDVRYVDGGDFPIAIQFLDLSLADTSPSQVTWELTATHLIAHIAGLLGDGSDDITLLNRLQNGLPPITVTFDDNTYWQLQDIIAQLPAPIPVELTGTAAADYINFDGTGIDPFARHACYC